MQSFSDKNAIDKKWLSEFYDGLELFEQNTFPKKCSVCGKIYKTVDEFIEYTKEIGQNSGLTEIKTQGFRAHVALFRNCACGSTLMANCSDRRGTSEQSKLRRKAFDSLLGSLIHVGVEKNTARKELRKFLRGEDSTVLEKLGIKK